MLFPLQNISTLLMIVNIELGKSGEWLKASKLSLNIEKAKYTFLQKFRAIKRTIVIKFLAYWFIFEKKLTKNIGLLYRAKYLLDESSWNYLFFLYPLISKLLS